MALASEEHFHEIVDGHSHGTENSSSPGARSTSTPFSVVVYVR